jgi:hypothetical protein
MKVTEQHECVWFFAEWNNFEHPVGDIALQFNYEWSTAAN